VFLQESFCLFLKLGEVKDDGKETDDTRVASVDFFRYQSLINEFGANEKKLPPLLPCSLAQRRESLRPKEE